MIPNPVIDCQLYVDKSEYSWGIPSDNAFACLKIPQGRLQFAISNQQLATLLVKPRWTASDALAIDIMLNLRNHDEPPCYPQAPYEALKSAHQRELSRNCCA